MRKIEDDSEYCPQCSHKLTIRRAPWVSSFLIECPNCGFGEVEKDEDYLADVRMGK